MKKQTKEEFINKSKSIFGNSLDYSLVEYIDSRTEITIICKIHGNFSIKPKDHISYKRSCNFCSGVRKNTSMFIEKAIKLHKNYYLYDKVDYKNSISKVIIFCKIHGDFLQSPDKHLNSKNGCPKCNKPRRDINYFLTKANIVHNNYYDYSEVKFIKMSSKVKIICPIHGKFSQTPSNHINHKQGCLKCMIGKSKKKQWLDYIGLPNDNLHRCIILKINNKKIIVDGFDPATNTVYEFYGDYWHGNPAIYNTNDINHANKKTFQYLYDKTIKRENFIKAQNYKLITIWENDFDKLLLKLG